MTPEQADHLMTRIMARIESDGGVLHKSSGIEEIIGGMAVMEEQKDRKPAVSVHYGANGTWDGLKSLGTLRISRLDDGSWRYTTS